MRERFRPCRWVVGLAMCGAVGAAAQGSTCEQFKEVLAARLEQSGVHGFGLAIVPAAEPAPPGTKVIGTCEGGARKVLYRRAGPVGAVGSVGAPKDPLPPAPPPMPAPAQPQAQAQPQPPSEPASPPAAAVEPARPAEASPATSAPAPVEAQPAGPSGEPSSPLGFGSAVWLAASVGALVALAVGAWLVRRRRYDSAGLPRGPRL